MTSPERELHDPLRSLVEDMARGRGRGTKHGRGASTWQEMQHPAGGRRATWRCAVQALGDVVPGSSPNHPAMPPHDELVGEAGALDRIAVYRLALELSDLACHDAVEMRQEPLLLANAAQLVRAVGSIAANVAEGYARLSARERIRFYGYALGSAEEARTWYRVSRPLLHAAAIDERIHLLVRIRRLLLTMIRNERPPTAAK